METVKLVDILARELKTWPEDCEAIEQDRLGSCLFKVNGPAIATYVEAMAVDAETAKVTRAQWQAAVDALKAEEGCRVTAEGLPPIGMHVVVHDDGSLIYGQGESGEVLAHVDGCAVIRMSYGLGCFLPRCLRTPDQIAAEERQNGIEELGNFLAANSTTPTPYLWEAAQKIYDAGYRKQVAP